MANSQELTLNVPDISCEHCVATINGTLRQQAGVSNVKVDIPTKTVTFKYDPEQVSPEKIEEVLDDAGYTVAK